MNRPLNTPEHPLARGAVALASIVASAACLCAVVLVFDRASSEPFLRDSAQARAAVAHCEALSGRGARDRCVHLLVAEARARDAEAARPTSVAADSGPAALRTRWR